MVVEMRLVAAASWREVCDLGLQVAVFGLWTVQQATGRWRWISPMMPSVDVLNCGWKQPNHVLQGHHNYFFGIVAYWIVVMLSLSILVAGVMLQRRIQLLMTQMGKNMNIMKQELQDDNDDSRSRGNVVINNKEDAGSASPPSFSMSSCCCFCCCYSWCSSSSRSAFFSTTSWNINLILLPA